MKTRERGTPPPKKGKTSDSPFSNLWHLRTPNVICKGPGKLTQSRPGVDQLLGEDNVTNQNQKWGDQTSFWNEWREPWSDRAALTSTCGAGCGAVGCTLPSSSLHLGARMGLVTGGEGSGESLGTFCKQTKGPFSLMSGTQCLGDKFLAQSGRILC